MRSLDRKPSNMGIAGVEPRHVSSLFRDRPRPHGQAFCRVRAHGTWQSVALCRVFRGLIVRWAWSLPSEP
jgi:hypothetical protein